MRSARHLGMNGGCWLAIVFISSFLRITRSFEVSPLEISARAQRCDQSTGATEDRLCIVAVLGLVLRQRIGSKLKPERSQHSYPPSGDLLDGTSDPGFT